MADKLNDTEIGFGTEDAIKELQRLELQTTTFAKAIDKLTGSTKTFNIQQVRVEDLLQSWTEAIKDTRLEMEKLASAQKKLNDSSSAKSADTAARRQRAKILEIRKLLQESLLPDRAGQGFDKLLKFDKAFESIENLSKRFKVSKDRIKAILGDLTAEYRGAERQIRDILVKMARENEKTFDSIADPKRATRQRNTVEKRFGFFEDFARQKGSPREITNFDKAGDQLEKLLTKTKITDSQLTNILGNMGGKYKGAELKVRDAVAKWIKALQDLGKEQDRINNKKPITPNPSNGPGAAFRGSLASAGRTALGVFGGGLALDATGSLSSAFRKSFDEARDLQVAFARIRTIAPPDLANNSQVQRRTSSISQDLGIDQLDVAKAAYESFSNQVGNTAESFAFLRKSGQFAKATITDYADAVDLLSGVLNAYNLRQSETNRIADQLFKTIDVGRVKAEQIANVIGNTLPLANQLGISTEELFGSIAALTIQGVSPDDALTQLRNVIQKLINPSEELQKALDKMGVSSVEAGTRGRGFIQFLNDLQKQTNGSIEEVNALFNEMRAGRGIASLNAQDGKLVADAIRKIGEESEGASEKAAKLIQDTSAEKLARNLATLRNELAADVGDELINAVNILFGTLGNAENAATGVEAAIGAMGAASVVAGGAIAINLISSTVESVAHLKEFTKESNIAGKALGGLSAVAIGFTIAVVIDQLLQAEDQLRKFRQDVDLLTKQFDNAIDQVIKTQQRASKEQIKVIQENTRVLTQNLEEQTRRYNLLSSEFKATQVEVTNSLKDQVNDRVRSLDTLVDKLDEVRKQGREKIFDLGTERLNFTLDANSAKFDLLFSKLDGPQQVEALKQRIQTLLEKATNNNTSGDFGFTEKLLNEAQQAAQRLGGVEGQELAAAKEIERILEQRKAINATLIAQEQEKVAAADRAKAKIVEQQRAIKLNVVEYNKLLAELAKTDLTDKNRAAKESKIDALGKKINDQLVNFDSAGLDIVAQFSRQRGDTDQIETLISEIKKPFLGLDGLPIKLENAIFEGFQKIRDSLQKVGFSQSVEAEIQRITGSKRSGPALLSDANKFITDSDEQAKNSEQNKSNIKFQEGELLRQKALIGNAGLRAELSFRGRTTETNNARGNPLFALLQDTGVLGDGRKATTDLANQVAGFKSTAEGQLSAGDRAGLQSTQNQVAALTQKIATTAGPDADREIQLLTEMSSAMSAAIQTLDALEKARADAKRGDETVQAQRELIEALNKNTQAIDGGKGSSISIERAVTPVEGSSLGRFLPQGRDKYVGAFDPGEAIINADSTRKFYSDLRAINAGIRPQMQNYSFGDIEINVSTNQTVDGATLARELRRHIRKGL